MVGFNGIFFSKNVESQMLLSFIVFKIDGKEYHCSLDNNACKCYVAKELNGNETRPSDEDIPNFKEMEKMWGTIITDEEPTYSFTRYRNDKERIFIVLEKKNREKW